jgi:hypothetical protein
VESCLLKSLKVWASVEEASIFSEKLAVTLIVGSTLAALEAGTVLVSVGTWVSTLTLTGSEATEVRPELFVFLRNHRYEIFTEEFQEELGAIYRESAFGRPPVPPAQLALATILQAYAGVSDDEAIEAMAIDRRWQLVLDSLDTREPLPFSKGTMVGFGKALIEHELDSAWSSARWGLPEGEAAFRVGACVRLWTPPRCGEQLGQRTPTTSWDTP